MINRKWPTGIFAIQLMDYLIKVEKGKICLPPSHPPPPPFCSQKLRVDEKDFRLFIHRNNVICL